MVGIYNILMMKYIKQMIRQVKVYACKDEISFSKNAFINLLTECYYTSEDRQSIMTNAIVAIDGNEGPANKDFKEHLNDILNLIVADGKDHVVDFSTKEILKFIEKTTGIETL